MRLGRLFGASAIFVGLVACGNESFQVAADSGADRSEPAEAAAAGDAGGRFCDHVDVAALGMAGAVETFCADFDAPGQTAASGWSSQVVANGTALLDTETWRSPPAAFSSVTLGVDASSGGNAYLVKALTKQANEVVFAFDFMGAPDGDFTQVATLSFDAPSGLYVLALKMMPTGISLTEYRPAPPDGGMAFIKDHLLSRKPEGAWIRVSLHATVGGAAPSCTVAFDGEVVLEQQLVVGGAASPTITVGALGVVPPKPHTYRFDNVVAATR
jgi:hypothetical protein